MLYVPVLAGFWTGLLTFFFLFVAVLLILIVLIQKGRGGGLVGAFSGLGSQGALGTKAGDIMTWITVVMASTFLLIAIVLTRAVALENRVDRGGLPGLRLPSGPEAPAPPGPIEPGKSGETGGGG
jgi:preprotein translocase subunit SecG